MNNKVIFKVIYLLILIIVPWFNANYFDEIKQPINFVESDFYEINPCKVSIIEFLYSNKGGEEFEYHFDSYSPIYCFGRISQYKEYKHIYIGTNFLISVILYIFVITVLLKDKTPIEKVIIDFKKVSIVCTLFSGTIFADRKYYNSILYFLDLDIFRSYIILFLFIFLISLILIETYYKIEKKVINLTPYLLLLTGNILHSNFNIFSILFIYLGVEFIKSKYKNLKYFKLYLFICLIWSINSRDTYIMENKIYPTLTATSYDIYSTFFYSIFFILFLFGMFEFVFKNLKYFEYTKFISNFTIVLIFIFFINRLNYQNILNLDKSYKFINIQFSDFLINNQKILFLYIFFFLYKYASTKKINKIDVGPILIIFLTIINFSNIITTFKLKYSLFLKFFSIYNPTFLELLIGSGPSNYNQFYVEAGIQTAINEHSFIASFWLFFGVYGLITILFLYKTLRTSVTNQVINKILIFLVLLNFFINDYLYDLSLCLMNLVLLNLLNKVKLKIELDK